MPHTTPAMFFEPLIHGAEVILKKVERLIGGWAIAHNRATRELDTPAIQHERVAEWGFAGECPGNGAGEWSAEECLSMLNGENVLEDGAEVESLTMNHRRDLVNLPGLADQVATYYEKEADTRSVHLSVDVAPDALVIGDSSALHQMVEQLMISALGNTPNGGYVTISGAVSHGVVTLSLCSYGPGTRLEVPSRFRDDSCAVGAGLSSQSTSLYPTYVGQILRAHAGRMKLSNQPGQGLRFVVRLPVA